MHEQHQPTEVVRWYTLARRFPQLIGRTPDGAKLWGGPYTITQAVGGGAVLFVGINTMGLWARWGFFGNALILLSLCVGVVVGLGRIPVGSRNPMSVVGGACRAATAPSFGRVAGRPVRPKKPRQLRHRIAIAHPRTLAVTPSAPRRPRERRVAEPAATPSASPASSLPTAPTAAPAIATEPAPNRRPALSGVQSLLAGTQLDRSKDL